MRVCVCVMCLDEASLLPVAMVTEGVVIDGLERSFPSRFFCDLIICFCPSP